MKITMFGTCITEDDTQLTYTNNGTTSTLALEFTGEDPDYGTEELICDGCADDTMIDLIVDQLDRLTDYLDKTSDGTRRGIPGCPELEDLNTSSLIAFERLLQQVLGTDRRKVASGVNENGHLCSVCSVSDASEKIREAFVSGSVRAVYIATEIDGSLDQDRQESWYKIIRLKLPFDNRPNEIGLLMGYCSGGNVTFAYSFDDSDTSCFRDEIRRMITDSTGLSPEKEIYVELIGVDDTHSYEIDHE